MQRTLFARNQYAACAVAVLAFTGTALAQEAGCPAGLSQLQKRLLAQAGQGPDALRRFIYIRRAILQIDTGDTMAWVEAVRASNPACLRTPMVAAETQPTDLASTDPVTK
jgi:hypothetical protein